MTVEPTKIPENQSVNTPAELESLLAILSHLLDAGVLRHCPPIGVSQTTADLRDIPPGGPWPDIVEAEFIDRDGRRYHLFVDTFHGSGGQWGISN